MNYIPEIHEKRHTYFKNFAESFFGKKIWENVLNKDKTSCIWLSAFFQTIVVRGGVSNEEATDIVYNSLKDKFLGDCSYDEFLAVFQRNNSKIGFKSSIPFLNFGTKKTFDIFEGLYLKYELKMHERGEI